MAKQQIDEEIKNVHSLQDVIDSYEKISATKMQNIRSSVLQNRDFLEELNSVFQQVKKSYKDQLEQLMKKEKITSSKFSLIKTNGKTLFVLLSANTGLYGNILNKTYDLFKNYVLNQNGEILIIGKLGQDIYKNDTIDKPFMFKDLEDTNVNDEKLKDIVNLIIQYEKVVVFHGKFHTTISQVPTATSVSGDPLPGEAQVPALKFFFEPSLEEIMIFFEKEIFTSYFEQTVGESQLAKHASRMISLDNSLENIKKNLLLLNSEQQRIRHIDFNKKQLETISSIKLWKK
jgi:ATP synthase F1 gamma subunit